MIDCSDLIGVPFEYGGRGPDSYDCYGLLSECHRKEGKKIPDYRSPTDLKAISEIMLNEKSKWCKKWDRSDESPFTFAIAQPGDTLLLNVLGLTSHVGFVISETKFLHTWQGTGGVVVERTSRWKHRIFGVYTFNENPLV